MPIFPILGLIFVTLKLTDHIDWSWWWVTAPFWGPAAVVVGLLLLALLGIGSVAGIVALVEGRGRR